MDLPPMSINGPTGSGNAQQPDYRVPMTNANVASYSVGNNMLNLTWPIPVYTQPGTTAPPPPVAGQLTGVGGVSYGHPS